MIREREQQKMDSQNKKLTRKEENDFYRAIMAYGVETKGIKNWQNFVKSQLFWFDKLTLEFHEKNSKIPKGWFFRQIAILFWFHKSNQGIFPSNLNVCFNLTK